MSEFRVGRRHSRMPHLLAVLASSCLILGIGDGTAGAAAAHLRPPKPAKGVKQVRATRKQSRAVLSCLKRSRLQDINSSDRYLWFGYQSRVGSFVYVQMYTTSKSATKEARFLKDEESGVAGKLVISQRIAAYKGSPVPNVVKCLHGKMVSKPPKKSGGGYKF